VDLHRFEKLIESEQFDDAMALSSGEVLAGIDDEWALRVRDAHRNKLVSLLRDGSDRAAADGNHNLAIARARQAADLNPLSESCARLLMRRYEEIGDRSIALGVYTRIVDRLRKELKIGPSEETWQLAQTIRRRGQHEGGHTMTAAGTVRPVGSDSVRRMERIGAVGVTTHHRQPVIGNNPYITQVRATPRTASTMLQRSDASVSLPGRIR
jgi:DNA-binding SARP family transcriptional activator